MGGEFALWTKPEPPFRNHRSLASKAREDKICPGDVLGVLPGCPDPMAVLKSVGQKKVCANVLAPSIPVHPNSVTDRNIFSN